MRKQYNIFASRIGMIMGGIYVFLGIYFIVTNKVFFIYKEYFGILLIIYGLFRFYRYFVIQKTNNENEDDEN